MELRAYGNCEICNEKTFLIVSSGVETVTWCGICGAICRLSWDAMNKDIIPSASWLLLKQRKGYEDSTKLARHIKQHYGDKPR